MRTKWSELKDAWFDAKMKANDYRGLGASRFKKVKVREHAAAIMFMSLHTDGKRHELEMNIDDEYYCWTWAELVKNIKEHSGKVLTINFTVNIWNKKRTDADRQNISSFTFIK